MRAPKSYLAADPSWFDEDLDLTCPRCESGPETFQDASLSCPARARVQHLLLKEVSSLGHDATIRTDSEPHLIRALGEYITDTKTGFPPDLIPKSYPAPSPPPTQG